MIRRRRRTREIPFSFDSFLDIVANVVGIIIRLILVVWIGARSYSSIQHLARQPAPSAEAKVGARAISDPLQADLARHREELTKVQERLLAQLRRLQHSQQEQAQARGALSALAARRAELESQQALLARGESQRDETARNAAASAAEIQARSRRLADEMRALELLPPPGNTLRYRTPVSRPLQSEELLFECYKGRVTFIDIGALLQEVRQKMEDQGKFLRTQWQIQDTSSSAGAFRLRYVIERERGILDSVGGAAFPESTGAYRYGLSEWQIEPVALVRGESMALALREGSDFRQIVDGLDPQHTAVTFWVYADSFDLYRKLRDFLYDRDVVVAGRPLPDGVPIASSRRGTISRGQ
jgi:hypothetical protein